MRPIRAASLHVLLLSACAGLAAQTPIAPSPAPTAAPSTAATTAPPALSPAASPAKPADTVPAALPRAFRGIELGMDMASVKKLLAADSMFGYRGDADVSLLPRPDESLIEVTGLSYVRRAFFQFHEDKLFVMIYALNEREVDHYSVFSSLSTKYGKPGDLSPSESVWADGATRLSLERPLAVKYVDMAVFEALKAAGAATRSYEEVLRSEFLGDF